MQKVFLTSIVAVALIIIAPIYTSFGAGVKEVKVERQPVQGYILSVHSERDAYRPEEQVKLIVTLKNVGNREVTPGSSAFLISSNFTVQLPDGQASPFTLYGKRWFDPISMLRRSGGSYLWSIQPKGEVSRSFDNLNRFYDMTLPGTYKISASIQVPKRDGTKGSVTLDSNTIAITIDENAKGDKTILKKSE